jgi:Ca2+-binding RTX toxin-like protein
MRVTVSNSGFNDFATIDGNNSNDILTAFNIGLDSNAFIYGDGGPAETLSGDASGGNDHLIADNSGDFSFALMVGDAVTMTDNAKGGNDTLVAIDDGVGSHATLIGDAEIMSGNAHGGNDVLIGGAGNDFLFGDGESYAGLVNVAQAGGNDVLNGGGGNDYMLGGPGNDQFVFNQHSGVDTIADFNHYSPTEHDVINVADYHFANFAALQKVMTEDSFGNTTIHFDANDSVMLTGVHAADLHAHDFLL